MVIYLDDYLLIVLFLISIIIAYLVYRRKDRNIRFFIIGLILIYSLLLIQVTIFPIWILSKGELDSFHDNYGEFLRYYQLIPFRTIGNTFITFSTVITQDGGNIILLMPLPIFVGFITDKFSIKRTFLLGFFVSISIELVQLLINIITRYPMHLCDIDDVILNSIGTVFGILLFILIRTIKPLYSYLYRICRKK